MSNRTTLEETKAGNVLKQLLRDKEEITANNIIEKQMTFDLKLRKLENAPQSTTSKKPAIKQKNDLKPMPKFKPEDLAEMKPNRSIFSIDDINPDRIKAEVEEKRNAMLQNQENIAKSIQLQIRLTLIESLAGDKEYVRKTDVYKNTQTELSKIKENVAADTEFNMKTGELKGIKEVIYKINTEIQKLETVADRPKQEKIISITLNIVESTMSELFNKMSFIEPASSKNKNAFFLYWNSFNLWKNDKNGYKIKNDIIKGRKAEFIYYLIRDVAEALNQGKRLFRTQKEKLWKTYKTFSLTENGLTFQEIKLNNERPIGLFLVKQDKDKAEIIDVSNERLETFKGKSIGTATLAKIANKERMDCTKETMKVALTLLNGNLKTKASFQNQNQNNKVQPQKFQSPPPPQKQKFQQQQFRSRPDRRNQDKR